MMRQAPRIAGLISLLALTVVSGGAAQALKTDENPSTNTIPETPPPAIEQYNYPGADQIFADHGIRLLKGDGNIIFVDCDTEAEVIKVESITLGTSCYEVIGDTGGARASLPGDIGWLTLEIPRVYALQGDDHNVAAHITTNGQTETVELTPGEHTPVGEGQSGDPATLVELRAS